MSTTSRHASRPSSLKRTKQYKRRLFFESLEPRRLLAIDAALLGDIFPGGDSGASVFVQLGSHTYFKADDGFSGTELWRSDGSNAALFADLNPAGGSNPRLLTVANGKLFFTAFSPATNTELWVTDGLSAPQVFDIRPGGTLSSTPESLTSYGGELFFAANNGSGLGLWHTNGVAAPALVPGTAGLNPSQLLAAGGKLYFTAIPTAAPSHSRIYTYDGASVVPINISGGTGSYGPELLTDFGGTVYFSGFKSSTGTGQELFKVTTPPAGPQVAELVMDIAPGGVSSEPRTFTVAGSNLFFRAFNGTSTKLWRTTTGGTTQQVADPIGVTIPPASTFAAVGSTLFFVGTSATGTGIFSSDGTTITSLSLTLGMNPDQLTSVGGTLYFIGTKAGIGRELWYLSGSTPTLVRDIGPGAASSSPDQLTAVGSALYFVADNGSVGYEPWIAQDVPAPFTLVLSQDAGGNLAVADTAGGNDDLSLQSDGAGGWTITGVGATFGIVGPVPAGVTANGNTLSIPSSAAGQFGKFLFHTGGGSDRLTVQLDGLGKAVEYDGGENPGDDDRLVVQSAASYAWETTTLDSAGGGDLDFDSNGSVEIHFANLEPVDTTGVAVANKIINLPASATATLKDYLAASDGFMQLAFNGTGPEDEQFQNPSASLTINATGGGSNLIQFETPDTGFAPTTLQFNGASAASDVFRLTAGFPDVLPNSSNLVMSSATLDLNGQNDTLGSLAGTGALTLDGGVFTTGGSGATTTYAGVISGTAAGGLTKSGPGTLILSSANTYTGSTQISSGMLLVNNTSGSGTGSGPVTVASTATLGGTGTAAGTVTVKAGGILSPGIFSPGILATGDLGLAPGAVYRVELNSPYVVAGTDYDQTHVTGTVDVGGASLQLVGGGPAGTPGQVLTILANDGIDLISGTFAGLPEGTLVALGSFTASLSYAGGIGGNDVTLTVAGPASFSEAGGGADFVLRRHNNGTPSLGDDLLQLLRNGVIVDSRPLSSASSFTLNGQNGATDTLAIDYAFGGFFDLPVLFHGGTGGSDALSISGSSFSTLLYNATGAGAGNLVFDGSTTITFDGLEPVAVSSLVGATTIQISDGLPHGAAIAAGLGVGSNTVTIDGGLESLTFTNPTLSLSLLGGIGGDALAVNSLDAAFSADILIDGQGGADTVILSGVLNLGAGNLTVSSEAIQSSGSLTTTGTAQLTATAGAISDGNGPALNIAAASLAASAITGIDLDTAVSSITASTSGAGDISLNEADGASLLSVTAAAGNVSVTSELGSLLVGTVTASGTVLLSAGESPADDVDNLAVVPGGIVQSSDSSVTLNSGDNLTISSTAALSASTTIAISIDVADADATGESLSVATGAILSAPGGATLNGGPQADTFNLATQSGTAIVVNGSTPLDIPGDLLNLDLAGATGATLTLDGRNDGMLTFTNRASVEYNSIEDINGLAGCYDLALSMASFGPSGDFTVRRGAPFASSTLEIVNNAGPAVIFFADLADIASLRVTGTANADTLTIDDVNGLITFDPACIPAAPFPDNANLAGAARLFFDGAGDLADADRLNFQLTESGASQAYAIGDGAGPGSGDGEVFTANSQGRSLTAYFRNLGPAGSVHRTGAGAAVGPLDLLGDASGNTLALTAAAGLTSVNPAGYTPFTFAPGSNFSQLNLLAAGGDDSYSITGVGPAGLDNLLVPVVIADASGTDSLVVDDSSDASGDTATITQSSIDGLNASVATMEVTFSGIENLDVTATSAADTLTTNLGTGPAASPTSFNGLVTVNIRGNGGADNMFLHVADSLSDASLNVVNLFGDADGDNFGGPAAEDHIRPVLRTGQTQIIINGDANAKTTGPVNPGSDPVLTSPDRLFLDMTTTDSGAAVLPILIVDTSGGYADAANTQSFRFNGIEDIDLYDGGVLTNTAIGDFLLRATEQADYIQFMSLAQVNPVFRIRVGNTYYPAVGSYGPYTTGGESSSRIFVYGRGGNDTITMYNTRLNAAFFGEAGDDVLTGGYGNDLLVGGVGNDRLNGAAVGGNDEIWGDDFNPATDDPSVASQAGGGNDQVNTYGGNDAVYGQGGNDILNTGAGDDYVNGGFGIDQMDGQAGNDRLYGGGDNDVISGADGHDVVAGNGGNDTLYGRTGNDILVGGLGQDIVNGNEGGDALVGDEASSPGSGSLARNDAVDAALLALLLSWSPAPTLAALGGFASAGDDTSLDTLWGGTEADAFFANGVDKPADRNAVGYGPDLN